MSSSQKHLKSSLFHVATLRRQHTVVLGRLKEWHAHFSKAEMTRPQFERKVSNYGDLTAWLSFVCGLLQHGSSSRLRFFGIKALGELEHLLFPVGFSVTDAFVKAFEESRSEREYTHIVSSIGSFDTLHKLYFIASATLPDPFLESALIPEFARTALSLSRPLDLAGLGEDELGPILVLFHNVINDLSGVHGRRGLQTVCEHEFLRLAGVDSAENALFEILAFYRRSLLQFRAHEAAQGQEESEIPDDSSTFSVANVSIGVRPVIGHVLEAVRRYDHTAALPMLDELSIAIPNDPAFEDLRCHVRRILQQKGITEPEESRFTQH